MKLIKISASWCMSCIILNEQLNNIEKKYNKSYEFIEYDYDLDKKEIEALKVGSILPVLILFNESKEIGRIIGEKDEKILVDFLLSEGAINEK